jgi:hypothetical protein
LRNPITRTREVRPPMLFNQPNSYRGKIPIELDIELQNKFPQADGECDLE